MNFRRMASQWRSSSKRRLAELSEEGAELPSLDETENAIKCKFNNGCYCGGKLTETADTKSKWITRCRSAAAAVPARRTSGSATTGKISQRPAKRGGIRSLLQLLDTWDPGAAQSLLVRLKGGYWVYRPTSDQRAAERRAVVKKALLNTPVEAPGSILSDPWPS